MTLTAKVRDLQHRFTAMESRFTAIESGAMEQRFSVQEERMSAKLAVIVRVGERLDRTSGPSSG